MRRHIFVWRTDLEVSKVEVLSATFAAIASFFSLLTLLACKAVILCKAMTLATWPVAITGSHTSAGM